MRRHLILSNLIEIDFGERASHIVAIDDVKAIIIMAFPDIDGQMLFASVALHAAAGAADCF